MEYGKHNNLMACLLCAAALLVCPIADQGHAAILQGIDIVSADDSSEVIVRIDEKVSYQYNSLPAGNSLPARCYLDLYSTFRNPSPPGQLVDNRHISRIRSNIYVNKLRIVIDLKKDSVCTVVSSATEPLQLHISVTDPTSPQARPAAAAAPELGATVPRPESQAAGEVVSPPQPETAPAADATVVTTEPDTQLADGQEASVWGWARVFAANDTREESVEDHNLYRLTGRLGADWNKKLNSDQSLELHAAVDVDRFFYDAGLADEETDLRLHETYLKLNGSDWDVAFGNQRVRWGKSDQLSPVDSINPQDFRQFVTIDLEERALPSWLLRNRWYGEAIGLETIVQPWFQESELEYFDSDWALYRNLRQTIMDNPLAPAWLKSYTRNIHVQEDEPAHTLENLSAAARFTWKTEQTDFAVSYHYGWETLPTITSFPVKNIDFSGDPDTDPGNLLADAVFTDASVQAKYKRQQTVGFEWEAVLDPVGFRGEVAHIDHVAFLTNDLTSERKPATHLVSGIDYTSASEWYFNLQGSWYHIHDYDKEILYFEENTVSVLGVISKPVWRGNLDLAVKYNYTLTDQSSYLQPSVTLKYFPNIECEIGANIFSGDGETLLGSYDRADQVYGVVKVSLD